MVCVNNTEDRIEFTFDNNFVTKQGGAMYVNDTAATACDSKPYERDPLYKECFVQTVAVYEKDRKSTRLNSSHPH